MRNYLPFLSESFELTAGIKNQNQNVYACYVEYLSWKMQKNQVIVEIMISAVVLVIKTPIWSSDKNFNLKRFQGIDKVIFYVKIPMSEEKIPHHKNYV